MFSIIQKTKGVNDVYYRFDTFDTRDGFVVARRQPVTRQPRSHDNFGGGGYVSDMVRKVSETMKHFRALDIFCGGGGAGLGILHAGFDEIIGIDIREPSFYPGTFIQADVRELPVDPMDFDMVWASPPCQRFSQATYPQRAHMTEEEIKETYPDLIPSTRAVIEGHPFSVIENVPKSPIRPDVILTGQAMGLMRIDRKRWFELSFWMLGPDPILASRAEWDSGKMVTITKSLGGSNLNAKRRKAIGLTGTPNSAEAKRCMGIPVTYPMIYQEIGESVPPKYSQFIASEVLRRLKRGLK